MTNGADMSLSILKLVLIICMVILVRVFIFDLFSISGDSMLQVIHAGDKLLISKIHYDVVEISRDDVVVFEKDDEYMVKRCVGLPGERIELVNGQIFFNEKKYSSPKTVNRLYQIQSDSLINFQKLLDSLNIQFDGPRENENYVHAYLDTVQYAKILGLRNINSITLQSSKGRSAWGGIASKWTMDNFGPIILPKKGMMIPLDSVHFELYSKTINEHEDVVLVKKNGAYLLNNKEQKFYTFKLDYYFVIGDNRNVSVDSRLLGFIPKNKIRGKAVLILFSNGQEGFNWSRIFKRPS